VSTADANKQTVRRLFDDLWNGRDLSLIPEMYRTDFVADYRPYAPLRHGHDGVRAMVEGALGAFPDYHEELLEICAEGDDVVVHLRISGTQLGDWGPLAPTGRRLEFEEMLWLTFDSDGRVARQRGIVDNLLALRQAGVIPSPPENDAEASSTTNS
jgi:predicted ester cyclase